MTNAKNAEILALAAEIGKAIKAGEEMKTYEAAEAAYIADEALQTKIREYSVQQQVLAQESAKSEKNAFLIETVQNRLAALYNEIVAFPTFVAFNEGQEAVRKLLEDVNAAMMREVTGEEPHSCSGDCSACGGCH